MGDGRARVLLSCPTSLLSILVSVNHDPKASSLAVYVCFAEDPDALYYNDRALFDQLAQVQELHVLDDLENAIYGDSDDDSSDDSDEFLELSSDSEDDDEIDPDMMITEKELEEVSTDESDGEEEVEGEMKGGA